MEEEEMSRFRDTGIRRWHGKRVPSLFSPDKAPTLSVRIVGRASALGGDKPLPYEKDPGRFFPLSSAKRLEGRGEEQLFPLSRQRQG